MQARRLLTAAVILSLTACGAATRSGPGAPDGVDGSVEAAVLDDLVDFLLAAAATDFHEHRPPDPVAFRDVVLVSAHRSDGARVYMLCGEFQAAREDGRLAWTPFATIRTEPYEQWIGDSAVGFCRGGTVARADVGDLSSRLQSRLDALRAAPNRRREGAGRTPHSVRSASTG